MRTPPGPFRRTRRGPDSRRAGHRSSRRASAGLPALRAAFLAGPRLADGRLVGTDLAAGIGVAIDTALAVAPQQVVAVPPAHVVRQQVELAAALWRVHHGLRHVLVLAETRGGEESVRECKFR